jgi:electron transfer flavoprotein alpha subunit
VLLEKARVVVAAGRGLRRREDLEIVTRLARALGGEVGASRPVTDDLQWLPSDAKVGLSGHTIRPELYVALGISGQLEHIVGMRESRVVVAINTDPGAPIFAESDYNVVGDLYAVIPALLRALEEDSAAWSSSRAQDLPKAP